MVQDGYAVRCEDGSGTFEVEFEAMAGAAPRRLSHGKIAYIGTGNPTSAISTESYVIYPHSPPRLLLNFKDFVRCTESCTDSDFLMTYPGFARSSFVNLRS